MVLRPSDVAATALVPATVLAYDPDGWFSFVAVKWLCVTFLGLCVVACVIAERGQRQSRRLAIAWGVFIAWLALAALVGLEGRYAWLGTPERHAGVLLWVLCGALFVFAPSRRALADGAVVAAAGLTLALVIGTAIGTSGFGLHTAGRLTSTFGSAAYLGAACTLLLPLVIGVAHDAARTPIWRAVAIAGSLGVIVDLVGSGTRAAWVAIVVVGAACAWRGWRPSRHWLGAAAIAAVATVVLSGSAQRVSTTFAANTAGGASRIDEWRVGLRTLDQHPLIGVGPEGYRLAFHEGVDAAYERAHGRDVQPDRAHNGLLDIALNGGVIGLGIYVVLLGATGRALWQRLRASPALAAPVAALAAYQLQQLFLFPLAELEPIAWALAGSLLADQRRLPAGHTPRRIGAPAAGALTVGALAIGALWWGWRDVRADRHALQAVRAYDRRDAAATRQELQAARAARNDEVRLQLLAVTISPDPTVVAGALQRAQELSPLDPIVIRRVADDALRSLSPAAALQRLSGLVADDPHNAYLQQRLGTAAAVADQPDVAELAWQRAADLDPRNPNPRAYLAALYDQQGRTTEALAAAQQALALHPTDQILVDGLEALVHKVGG